MFAADPVHPMRGIFQKYPQPPEAAPPPGGP